MFVCSDQMAILRRAKTAQIKVPCVQEEDEEKPTIPIRTKGELYIRVCFLYDMPLFNDKVIFCNINAPF